MIITIKNEKLQVKIDTLGAELKSICTTDGCEYLWQGDPAIWDGQAPNLFPYIARLTQGKYSYGGKEYQMPIHGFLPTTEVQVEKQCESSITFLLESNEDTLQMYPFVFALRLTYTLEENIVKVETQVDNKDNKTMYFGIGGHPGFNVPLEEGLSFTDYRLEFADISHPARVGFTKDVFLSGVDEAYPLKDDRFIPLSHDLFDEDAIILKHVAHEVSLISDKGNRSVTVRYPDVNVIGFWHMPMMEAPYVCIEPWSSLPSRQGIIEHIDQQSDLIALGAQQRYRNSWEIEIK